MGNNFAPRERDVQLESHIKTNEYVRTQGVLFLCALSEEATSDSDNHLVVELAQCQAKNTEYVFMHKTK